jgi:hypothetical protein
MILYNVTLNIDNSVHEDWLKWMREIHIPEVMATGMFTENKLLRLLNEEDSESVTYCSQYTARNMNDYETYIEKHADGLRAKFNERYKDKFVAFRTLLEIIQ